MILKNNAKFEEELKCCFKINMRNLTNFDPSTYKFWSEHSQVVKICTLMGPFWQKYIMLELKKYRGVIFHDTEKWCEIWRKADMWFGKWPEEFDKFSPELSEVSKLGLWWDLFMQSRKCVGLKFTEELCVMKRKNDAKFEEEWTCRFKINMKNLTDIYQSTWKSQKFALYWAPFDQSIKCLG